MPLHLKGQRIHYMDHLRALAMILGVFYHSAAGYSTQVQYEWFIRHIPSTDILSVFRILSHDFRMPLFFLISGFFASLLLERRSVQSFIGNRIIRLLMPLILFSVVTYYALNGIGYLALGYLKHSFFVYIVVSQGEEEAASTSLFHLWFLRYLFEFCVIAAVLQYIRHPFIARARHSIFSSSWTLVMLPLIIVPGYMLANEHMSAPTDLLPELWPYLYYGAFFLIGWHIFKQQDFIQIINAHIWKLSVVAAILFCVQVYVKFSNLETEESILPHYTGAFLFSFLKLYLVFIILGLGQRFLNFSNEGMRYMSDASYWIYISHLPIVLFIQTLLAPLDMSLWLKFVIVTALTLAITAMTYHLFVRYTVIGWLLNGKRQRMRKPTDIKGLKAASV
ncbi:MAG: acyltransferase family protein [Methyloligellaceae bacterium]